MGNFLEANKTFADMFGYSKEQLENSSFEILYPTNEEFVKINATNAYEPRLKEITYLSSTLDGSGKYTLPAGWWDIDNDWFMTIGQEDILKVIDGLMQR